MDEFGRKIEETADFLQLLPRFLPPEEDPAYPLLGSIDPYGNTIFNGLQMKRFLSEWESVASRARSSDEEDFMATVKRMATRCRDEVHVYLKFVGD